MKPEAEFKRSRSFAPVRVYIRDQNVRRTMSRQKQRFAGLGPVRRAAVNKRVGIERFQRRTVREGEFRMTIAVDVADAHLFAQRVG